MKPQGHIVISSISAISIFLITKSFLYSIINFIIGIFIDLDHLVDYYISKPGSLFDYNDFVSGNYIKRSKKSILLLHAYEIIIVLTIFTFIKVIDYKIGIVIITAYFLHILADQIYNNVYMYSYFLSYRIIKKYDYKYIYKLNKDNKHFE